MPYKDQEAWNAWKRKDYAKKAEQYRERTRLWKAAHPDSIAKTNKKMYASRKAEFAALRAACPQTHRIRNAAYKAAHPDRYAEIQAKYYSTHKGEMLARTRKYQLTKAHATPPWLTTVQAEQIKQVYVEAKRREQADGIKRHVDHIYPLKGKTCCGLHVPWNLQILTAVMNRSKSNKVAV